ncbi:hypothetical protein OKW38_002783 [Paraburkholderia sp. MM5496-R1]
MARYRLIGLNTWPEIPKRLPANARRTVYSLAYFAEVNPMAFVSRLTSYAIWTAATALPDLSMVAWFSPTP